MQKTMRAHCERPHTCDGCYPLIVEESARPLAMRTYAETEDLLCLQHLASSHQSEREHQVHGNTHIRVWNIVLLGSEGHRRRNREVSALGSSVSASGDTSWNGTLTFLSSRIRAKTEGESKLGTQ